MLFFAPQPEPGNQSMEMGTVAVQEDTSEPTRADISERPTVGPITGLVTVVTATLNLMNLAICVNQNGNFLYFVIPDLLISAIIPVSFCISNTQILFFG